jgi:hypothetical protein
MNAMNHSWPIGPVFLGIDALGWGMIFFLLLLFGIPYTRFFLRRASIPDWPITEARVTRADVLRGVPNEFVPRIAIRPWRVRTLVPFHCRAQYVYLVDGATYAGWFALFAMDSTTAQDYATRLAGHTVLVKYDPRHPKDSTLEEPKMFDRTAVQEQSNVLNPKVW